MLEILQYLSTHLTMTLEKQENDNVNSMYTLHYPYI